MNWRFPLHAHIAQGGELIAPGARFGGVDLRHQDLLARIGLEYFLAHGIEEGGAAVVGEGRIGAGAVDAEDEGLVFDGAGLEEADPVLAALVGPVGDNDDQLSAGAGRRAEELREAEVVADEGGDVDAFPLEGFVYVAGGIMDVLSRRRERLHLAIADELRTLRGERD